MGLVSLGLAFFMPPVGFVVAIIARFQLKKAGTSSIANTVALVWSSFYFIMFFVSMALMVLLIIIDAL